MTKLATFIESAKSQLSKGYSLGATGPDSFDCSGLIVASLAAAGFANFPRTSAEQYQTGEIVNRSQLQPGDLVFFDFAAPPARVAHVGIYLGDGQMVNAQSQSPAAVCTASIDSGYWAQRILGFRRIIDSGDSLITNTITLAESEAGRPAVLAEEESKPSTSSVASPAEAAKPTGAFM